MCDVDSDEFRSFEWKKKKLAKLLPLFKDEEQFEYFTMLPLDDKQRQEVLKTMMEKAKQTESECEDDQNLCLL